VDPRYRWFCITFRAKTGNKTASFVFRGFTGAESRRAGGQHTAFDSEVFLLKCCVPNIDLDAVEYNICSRLLKEIYHVSGWNEHGAPYKLAAEWIQDETGSLEAAAVCMIPGLTLQELDTCDPQDKAKYLIMGKWLFESLYQCKVEEAFSGKKEPKKGGTIQAVKPKLPENHQVVESFDWDSQSRTGNVLPDDLTKFIKMPEA